MHVEAVIVNMNKCPLTVECGWETVLEHNLQNFLGMLLRSF